MSEPAPDREIPRRWMPSYVCRDMHQVELGGRVYFLGITITAELTGDEPAGPLPVKADLGRRIAEMIRADCASGQDGSDRDGAA
jgi:hypothetical protein